MLQDDRENLELEKLQNETRKLVVERLKLMAEEGKLKARKILVPSRGRNRGFNRFCWCIKPFGEVLS